MLKVGDSILVLDSTIESNIGTIAIVIHVSESLSTKWRYRVLYGKLAWWANGVAPSPLLWELR